MHPLSHLLDLILPRHCAVCGAVLLAPESCLCTRCVTDMPLTYFWQQEHNPMADKFNARIQQLRDDVGYAGMEPYSCAAALFFYKGDYRYLTKGLKYDANMTLGRYVADALGRKLSSCEGYGTVDMIIPVPLHWTRRFRRGYNQSEVIAASVASHLCGRVENSILWRVRRTASQVNRSVSMKAANVSGAFEADFVGRECPSHILLVDDVFTSGSTMAECHAALRRALRQCYGTKKAAAVRISAATLAFVGD